MPPFSQSTGNNVYPFNTVGKVAFLKRKTATHNTRCLTSEVESSHIVADCTPTRHIPMHDSFDTG